MSEHLRAAMQPHHSNSANRRTAAAWDATQQPPSHGNGYAVAPVAAPPPAGLPPKNGSNSIDGYAYPSTPMGKEQPLQFAILDAPASLCPGEYKVMEDMQNIPICQCTGMTNVVKMTNKRVIVTYLYEVLCGCMEKQVTQSMFTYRDVVDINIGNHKDRRPLWIALGAFIFFLVIGMIVGIQAESFGLAIAFIAIGAVYPIMVLIKYFIEMLNGGLWVNVDLCKQNVGVGSWAMGYHQNPKITTTSVYLPRKDAFTFMHAVLQHPEVDLLHGLKGHTITDRSRIMALQPVLPV